MYKISKSANCEVVYSKYKTAPNIALIKYWGKYDNELILPLNSSVSVTLSNDDLYTQTYAKFSKKYKSHRIIINEKEENITSRIQKIFTFFLNNCTEVKIKDKTFSKEDLSQMHFKIKSTNNFPTASGLASSASGLACLVLCLADIFQFKEQFPDQLSLISRLGSGSACRGLQGGLVQWNGVPKKYLSIPSKELSQSTLEELSRHCVAHQLKYSEDIMKKYEILIIIQSFKEKKIKSTSGMEQTFQTSELLRSRVTDIVDKTQEKLLKAFEAQDYNQAAEIICRDSNQFHATCLDTYPPIFYLNSFSQEIIQIIAQYNAIAEKKVAYTFDAGAHSTLLIQKEAFQDFFKFICQIYSVKSTTDIEFNENAKKYFTENKTTSIEYSDKKIEHLAKSMENCIQEKPSFIFKTQVGQGPIKVVDSK